jgi:hypothetical protein
VRNAVVIALGAVLVVGCGDDDGGSAAPDRLYLALLDSELSVQLVEREPEPF